MKLERSNFSIQRRIIDITKDSTINAITQSCKKVLKVFVSDYKVTDEIRKRNVMITL